MDESAQLTLWLSLMRQGDQHARERVIEAAHTQLRVIASRLLQRANHTLEPNALVNELCVRLFGGHPLSYTDRSHFFAIAAQTMRRILIDHARAGLAGKRGGEQQRVSLSGVDGWSPLTRNEEILDAALAKLTAVDARAAQVVEMRFFGGLQEDEVAEVLGVSTIFATRCLLMPWDAPQNEVRMTAKCTSRKPRLEAVIEANVDTARLAMSR